MKYIGQEMTLLVKVSTLYMLSQNHAAKQTYTHTVNTCSCENLSVFANNS